MTATILIVDDNTEMLETMAHMLHNMGAQVHTATNASLARHILDTDPSIALVVCDWNMPEQSGIDLLTTLRNEGKEVPFIMVTARSDTDSVLEASSKGVDLYICKPFSSEELHRKIGWVIKGTRRTQHFN